MSEKESGIYRVVNTSNGKCYVGSATSLRRRKSDHFRDLRAGKHPNNHLQRAWWQSGEEAFKFEVIELCGKDVLIEREQYWIDTLKPAYNIRKVAHNNHGVIFSQRSRERRRAARAKADAEGKAHGGAKPKPDKLRSRHHVRTDEERLAMHNRRVQALTGRTISPEAREKIRQAQLGRKASPETLEKLRQSHLGQKPTPEALEKNRQAQRGRTLSPEAREKIRQSKLGKKRSPEVREKLRQANLGKKLPPEQIAKMTERPVSDETKQKLREARQRATAEGKPHGGPKPGTRYKKKAV